MDIRTLAAAAPPAVEGEAASDAVGNDEHVDDDLMQGMNDESDWTVPPLEISNDAENALPQLNIPPNHRPLFPGEELRRLDKCTYVGKERWTTIGEKRRGEAVPKATEENNYQRYCRPTHPLAQNWYVDLREGCGSDVTGTGSTSQPFASVDGAKQRILSVAKSKFRQPHGVIWDVRGVALFAFDLGEVGAEHASIKGADELDSAARIGRSLYDRVSDHLQPQGAGSPWGFLNSKLGLFRPPEDGSQLLADLRSSHTDEELLEAGLATRLPSNELVLSLSMESSDSNVLIVRDLETEVSVGVLTSHGPLNGELGIFADLDRCESVLLDADEGPLFFSASTLEDLAVLRGCGIPATLANGLDSLSPEDAAWLCKAYRVENLSLPSAIDDDDADQDCDDLDPMRVLARGLSGSNKADSPSPSAEEEASLSRPIPRVRRRLVLVGFDVAGLSNAIPASLNRVADHFGQLREHMGIDPGDVRVWQPDEMEVKRFKYFAEHGDATRLNKAMLESIADGLQDLPTYGTRPPPELEAKIALPEALTSFHRALRLSGHSMHAMEARQKAWRHLEEALDTELIEPMVEHALQAADPMERNLRLMAAMTARLAHVRALHLSAQTSIAMRQGGIDSLESLPQDGVKTVLALGKQMIDLHKEISQCQNTTRILPMERFPREKPPLALLPSE